MKTLQHISIRLTLISLLAASILPVIQAKPVHAVTAADWKAGHIIADGLFTNGSGMSTGQIQEFMNAKVPACDTDGTKLTTKWNASAGRYYTRAEWGQLNGNPAPFTCLRDYYEVPKTQPSPGIPANNYGGKPIPDGAKSAAQLIADASQRYSINPKVLLVTIQKESHGPLTVDDWPWLYQYTYAMGAHCPDSGPGGSANCDENYAGFSIQISESARLFRYYLDNMGQSWWPYKKPGNNHVLWNVSSTSCGGADVWIETMATAALYTYTPYQPNKAALDNMYGTGDGCSAYGNRNFWRIFNDWFGSTQTDTPFAWSIQSQEVYTDVARTNRFTSTTTVTPGSKLYMRIKARNIGNQTWDQSFMRLGTSNPRDRNSLFKDTNWVSDTRPTALLESSVIPGMIGTFEFTMSAPQNPGSYREYFNLVADGRTWLADYGLYYPINVVNNSSPQSEHRSGLTPGQTLDPGEYLLSPDRQSTLVLQGDGNVVLYTNFRPVWHTNTMGRPSSRLVMQDDGNLVLYDKNGGALWTSGTAGQNGASLALQTDGNLVIYQQAGGAAWSIGTVHIPNLLSYVNPTLGNNAGMYPGQRLETADRRYTMVLQADGNLVVYSPSRALWASNTVGKNVAYLSMQEDGNLVLYDRQGKAVWWSGTNGRGPSRLLMQEDGNLVTYNGQQATWASNTRQ